MFWLYGESFHHRRLNQFDDNRARSYHYQIYAPPLGCLDLILSWVAIGSLQPMQESRGEPTTAWTNVYMGLFIQETRWSISNTFLTRYRSGGTPNEPQPQGVCELQGWQIEAPGLPALVLPVNAYRWVLADNTIWHARWDPSTSTTSTSTVRMLKGDQVTYEELTSEHKQKFDEIKALFEVDLIGSFERTCHHGIRWKGFSPEGALDGVDLSLPSEERTRALRQEVNYMIAHSLHRHFESLVNAFERVALRVI
jgi:hypothetical protein